MRRTLTTLHRVLGLLTAGFLFIAGSTGALIAWDHELDALLNPRFYRAARASAPVDMERALAFADQLEQRDPRLRVTWLPLANEHDEALLLSVGPRLNPQTGHAFELGFNQVALDPSTGQTQAQREWGAVSLSRENILPFLYKLHYSLHIPDVGSFGLGLWVMGLIAVAWVMDTVIALIIAFPSRKVWRKSLRIRWQGGATRLNFDLHRSGGVWVWPLLLVLAITAVSMNLGDSVMRPLVSVFSTLTPDPVEQFEGARGSEPKTPNVTRAQVLELARAEAKKRGFAAPLGGMFFANEEGTYGVGFFEPGNTHGDGGLGNPYLHYDGRDGRFLGAEVPGEGSAGDLFLQAQFPLHSGRIAGVAGRVVITLLGLVIAGLSVTGLVIWAQRRRKARARQTAAAPSALSAPSEAYE
ncbi:MAG TPA: PepSY-associated TM helix domain-containing protein [Polyangiales bacterium]|nr:PepSY-associated TM helix domain-containing protein [Polyangiales bacterium]